MPVLFFHKQLKMSTPVASMPLFNWAADPSLEKSDSPPASSNLFTPLSF